MPRSVRKLPQLLQLMRYTRCCGSPLLLDLDVLSRDDCSVVLVLFIWRLMLTFAVALEE